MHRYSQFIHILLFTIASTHMYTLIMANEFEGCNCAFCLYLSLSNIEWLSNSRQDEKSFFANSKKIQDSCNSSNKRVVSKIAVRDHVSPVKHNKTACEVALLAI